MLTRLSIRDIVLIDRLEIDFAAGPWRCSPARPARASRSCSTRSRSRSARAATPAWCAPAPSRGRSRAAFELPPDASRARRCWRRNDIAGGRTSCILRRGQWPTARSRAFVNDQPVSVQVLSARRGAGRDPRPARRSRAGRRRAAIAGCSTPSAGSTPRRQTSSALGGAARGAKPRSTAHRAEVERAQREADWLRHAVEELERASRRSRRRRPRWPTGAPP